MKRALVGAFAVVCACGTTSPSPTPPTSSSPIAPPKMAAGRVVANVARPPDPPTAQAYDRVADREARVAEARAELGRGVPTEVVEDVFLVVGAPGWTGPSFTQSVALVRNAMTAYYEGRFRRRPDRMISVYLFPSGQPYEAYCKTKWAEKCLSKYGFYRPDERRMVMNAGLGLGTLTHELVHPLVEADFPTAPAWINEGIASLFEAPVIPRKGEIHGVKNWRHPRLLAALANPKERSAARLDALFGMNDDTFRDDDEDLHYAMARYACQWLDDRGKLWAFYQAWRDDVVDDPSGTRAFTRVVGKAPADMDESWTKWVKSL